MSQTVQQTADPILAMINARPRTPIRDELVTVLKAIADPVRAAKGAHTADKDADEAAEIEIIDLPFTQGASRRYVLASSQGPLRRGRTGWARSRPAGFL